MPMTSDELMRIGVVMRTLDEIFPRDRRDEDFPPEAQNIDVILTMDAGFIALDAKNQFVFIPLDHGDVDLVEACVHANSVYVKVESPDTVVDHEIIQVLKTATRVFAEHDVTRVLVNITDPRPFRIRRVFDWPPVNDRDQEAHP